jgi:signal-transduction protein with cAMP-binding, CBS, and nucleotidyltransferase domain
MNMEQTVLEAKRIGVFTCHLDCKLKQASAHMREEDISALVVIDDEGCLAGIITRIDLLRAWMEADNWKDDLVRNYMSREVITVTESARLVDVAKVLLQYHIHRVVVVRHTDGKHRPVAVVSAADLIYHLTTAT